MKNEGEGKEGGRIGRPVPQTKILATPLGATFNIIQEPVAMLIP
jgi:hypothetical protein